MLDMYHIEIPPLEMVLISRRGLIIYETIAEEEVIARVVPGCIEVSCQAQIACIGLFVGSYTYAEEVIRIRNIPVIIPVDKVHQAPAIIIYRRFPVKAVRVGITRSIDIVVELICIIHTAKAYTDDCSPRTDRNFIAHVIIMSMLIGR